MRQPETFDTQATLRAGTELREGDQGMFTPRGSPVLTVTPAAFAITATVIYLAVHALDNR
ncbi:hypothetical protein AAH978_21610 [Streptomyces sp. ZYX-F-203]